MISGDDDLSFSPLRTFLTNPTFIEGRRLYLVDQNNQVIAATEDVPIRSLERHAPEFISPTAQTTANHDGEEHLVVTTPVGRTSWRLVAAVPTDARTHRSRQLDATSPQQRSPTAGGPRHRLNSRELAAHWPARALGTPARAGQ